MGRAPEPGPPLPVLDPAGEDDFDRSWSTEQRSPLLERLPPLPMGPVPIDGLCESLLERHLRLVAELGPDLGDVPGVAQVVAEPVWHLLHYVPPGTGGLEQPAGQLLVGE